jgi:hypothetical protein
MSEARGEHLGAVFAAKEKIGEIQALLASCTDLQETAVGMMASATGGYDSVVDSGRRAFEGTALLKDRIADVYALTEHIVTEADLYLRGL